MVKKYITGLLFLFSILLAPAAFLTAGEAVTSEPVAYQEGIDVTVHFFGRDDCKFCKKEKAFLDSLAALSSVRVNVIYYDVMDRGEGKALFDRVTEANELGKVSPLTAVGGKLIQGYDADETTGEKIMAAIRLAQDGADHPLEYYFQKVESSVSGGACNDDPDAQSCEIDFVTGTEEFQMKLPLMGVVDLTDFSLGTLSLTLGFIDGFNPCAMWVLVTFLLILMQLGDRRKLFYVAGLFILAEGLMYYMILNVWYQTWDFIGLDAIVTPLIGLVAIGGGVYFLHKYYKTKDQLVCDVTDIEYQSGVEKKIQALVHSPATIATILGIFGIAFSVNIIEFACSIGIPQAFTKILELNGLSFLGHQFYILLYTLAYMIDDLIVFGFAFWGITKIQSSYKYSKYSSLIGGILMLILGAIMLLAPDMLVL